MPAMSPRPTTAFPMLKGRQGAWGGGLKHMGAESPQHNTLNKITTKTRGHDTNLGKRRNPQYIHVIRMELHRIQFQQWTPPGVCLESSIYLLQAAGQLD